MANRLPPSEYFTQEHKKDLIVLHHTVGGTAQSTIEWWKKDPSRIATAYIVERDGTVFELFDPKYWAYHLGIRGSWAHDKRSIGIELASEGPLFKQGDKFIWAANGREYRGQVFDCGKSWRGYQYFAAYTEAQVVATVQLTRRLCTRFNIPLIYPKTLDFDVLNYSFKGVLAHAHLRRDKSDTHPGFPWERLGGTAV